MRPGAAESDDAALLRATARGDEEALAALYDRHAGWLTVRMTRRCPMRDVVDQAVQDTFLALWRGAGGYRAGGDVAAFIWGIGIRRVIRTVSQPACRSYSAASAPSSPPATARSNAASSLSAAPGLMPETVQALPDTTCRSNRPVRFPSSMTKSARETGRQRHPRSVIPMSARASQSPLVRQPPSRARLDDLRV